MEKYYNFAGVDVVVSIPDKWIYENERTLEEFLVSQVNDPHYYQFEIVDELLPPSGNKIAEYPDYCVYVGEEGQIRYLKSTEDGWEHARMRILHSGKKHFVQVKATEHMTSISAKTVLNAINLEHVLIEEDGVIFHASYIEYNGKAILFTAPSGTGKSTQADLWNKYRGANIVNGDRTVMKMEGGVAVAAGIPFAGSSIFCENKAFPLQAIVYLGQAKENSIEKLSGLQAFRKVWEGCTVNNWNQDNVSKTLDVVQKVIGSVSVYYLKCTPDEQAIITLEKVLEGETNYEK